MHYTAGETVKGFHGAVSRSLDAAQRNPGLGYNTLMPRVSARPPPDSAALHPGYVGHAPNTFTISGAVSRVWGDPSKSQIGGERGIRTLDGLLTHTPLAGERLQPLGHLSGKQHRVDPRGPWNAGDGKPHSPRSCPTDGLGPISLTKL
jgi:hypothetical protein